MEQVAIQPETRSTPLKWLTRPLHIFLALVAIGIPVLSPGDYAFGALLAYVNCVIILSVMFYMLKRDPILGIPIVLSMIFLLFAWSAPSVYFCLLRLEPAYNLLVAETDYPMLTGLVRVQLVVLAFLVTYVPSLLVCFRAWAGEEGIPVTDPKRVARTFTIFVVAVLTVFDIALLSGIGFPGGISVSWFVFGIQKYNVGLSIIIGALWLFLSRKWRLGLAIFGLCHAGLFALAGMRSYGLMPLVFFFLGLFFLSLLKGRSKITIIVVLILGFSAYMTLGTLARGGQGWSMRNLGDRFSRILSGGDDEEAGAPPGYSLMTRLFMTGGHRVITQTPEHVSHTEFDTMRYIREVGSSVLPGYIYYDVYYRGNSHLLRYDMNVEFSSIEISLLGHFWMIGGWAGILFGGLATGLMQGFAMYLIVRARRTSAVKGVIYMSLMGTAFFYCFGGDFIGLFRSIPWHWAMAALIWALLGRISGEKFAAKEMRADFSEFSPPDFHTSVRAGDDGGGG